MIEIKQEGFQSPPHVVFLHGAGTGSPRLGTCQFSKACSAFFDGGARLRISCRAQQMQMNKRGDEHAITWIRTWQKQEHWIHPGKSTC